MHTKNLLLSRLGLSGAALPGDDDALVPLPAPRQPSRRSAGHRVGHEAMSLVGHRVHVRVIKNLNSEESNDRGTKKQVNERMKKNPGIRLIKNDKNE